MKQLPMTPELADLIHKAVGPDVDTTKLAVFETIALNNKPLPGKAGTLFENAVTLPITLVQMADYIDEGNHLPLMADHELFGAPKGRFFHAGVRMADDGATELRALFYLDSTEADLIAKLDAGSLDEVSVQFLASAMLCSECGWDYFGPDSTNENIYGRVCGNGHEIGVDGVHTDLLGLNKFIELSLVARGAADKPKIIGKSEAKLAPESAYRLAARGFEPDALVVRASIGKEEVNMADNANIMAELTTEIRKTATLTAEKAGLETKLTAAEASVTSLTAERDELQTKLTAAEAKNVVPEDYEPSKAEAAAGVAFLQEQLNHLRVAKGETKLEGDALPSKVADLKEQISTLTDNLTSILPVGGKSQAAGAGETDKAGFNAAAFSVRK